MKFGVREIANVVFKATANGKIGSMDVVAGQPILYIESAKTSTLEGAATTVYAQGGRGNTRLIAWEGEKTLTFTVEDALLSPISFAMLSGAGLIDDNSDKIYNYHMTSYAEVGGSGIINLDSELAKINALGLSVTAPLFVLGAEEDGSLNGDFYTVQTGHSTILDVGQENINKEVLTSPEVRLEILDGDNVAAEGTKVFVDYYVKKKAGDVKEMQIDAEHFAGYYYVEADTLFKRQSDGVDMPANITLPKVKIQSNFTFTMASTGDPSTFTFTMDALPGYTKFNKTREVLCVIQVIDDTAKAEAWHTVMDIDINNDNATDEEGNLKLTEEDVVKLSKDTSGVLTDSDSFLNE